MNYFWLDANAIVKQYVTEIGTPLINHLFTHVSLRRILCLFDSMDETLHVFGKQRNDGRIKEANYNQVIRQFEAGFIYHADVEKVDATQNQKIAARQFIKTYSLNNTDAYILQCALDKANELRAAGDDLIFVSSDRRPLRAARTEGLLTFDPENGNQINLNGLINSP